MHGFARMFERKTHRKELFCGIICMLGQQTMCSNMQIIRREKHFFIPTSSVFLAFGLALREISLNVNNHVNEIFWKLWGPSGVTPSWGVTLEKILGNTTLTLLENPGYTMAEIPLLLYNQTFRKHLVNNLSNDQVQDFWEQEYNTLSGKDQREEIASTLTRVNSFIRQPLVRNIVGQPQTTVDFRTVMDERKILLVRLNVRLGEGITTLLGTMIIAEVLNAAYSRADLPVNKRKQFNLYADEFQRFATEDFATLLTEARKFGIGTTIAHQFRNQLDQKNRGATLTVANLVVFRVQPEDATELAGSFNITPQEAWEEELKEERLEVLKEEWTEKVEDEVIDGEEPVQVYKREIVDHLLKQGHEDERMMDFVRNYLRPLEKTSRSEEVWKLLEEVDYLSPAPHPHDQKKVVVEVRGNYPYKTEDVKEELNTLNDWLYEGMCGKKGKPLPESMLGVFSHVLKYGTFYHLFYADQEPRVQAETEKVRAHIRDTERLLWESLHLDDALAAYHASLANQIRKNFYKMDGFREDISEPEQERMIAEGIRNYYRYFVDGMMDEAGRFEKFAHSLIHAKQALSDYPLMTTASGLYQPRKRSQTHYITHPRQTLPHPRIAITHPQRSYADMLNEVASELVNLPAYTTRAKIATEEKPNEHTIRTLEPERGLGGAALQERIKRIQERNRDVGYTRLKQDVEAEIRTRQNQWKEPHEPPPILRRPQTH
jgi:hypothetical protein